MQCLLLAARWGFAFDNEIAAWRGRPSPSNITLLQSSITRHPSSTMPIASDPQAEDPVVANCEPTFHKAAARESLLRVDSGLSTGANFS